MTAFRSYCPPGTFPAVTDDPARSPARNVRPDLRGRVVTDRRSGQTSPEEKARLAAGIGRQIRIHRQDAELSTRQLAGLVGLDHSYIVRLESGDRRPRPQSLVALGVVLAEILDQSYEIGDLWNFFLLSAGDDMAPDTAAGRAEWRARARRLGRTFDPPQVNDFDEDDFDQ